MTWINPYHWIKAIQSSDHTQGFTGGKLRKRHLASSPCRAVGQLSDTFLDVVVQALDMAKA